MNEKLIVYSTILIDDSWEELGNNLDVVYVWKYNSNSRGVIDKDLIYMYELNIPVTFYGNDTVKVHFKHLKFIKEINYE